MADTSNATKDIPSSLVFEALHSRVTVETVEGDLYKGTLAAFDVSRGNIELVDVRHHAKDSSFGFYERVTVRGSKIRIILLPSEMKAAPSLQWRRESVQQELKKSLKHVPALRPVVPAPRPLRIKKAQPKNDKSKQLRKKLR
ncbi:putative small nuclear ribonucleaoprotein [Leishmania infantum JPCM5]|uniref:U2_small_nuclear_ribonucleoprotein_16.5K_-_putativeGeneDB:LmjF.36.0535 n=2 Tax=Leishmania infantum TaxID=5671 RepID=A0A6L0Y1E0_LEIIN|nr:putative small nuclear ribonucleaoprotein [Leishmania infantum JPCM5]CAC9548907.1 U2_small_nuclear_ribonucleoprotein_16.5K_-_putativeGeneDB:LmjF.36.0535 [Leishmania infantum]CAM72661.1 putative small nuclear ribonucleaoprotein [Leishmania infantum JPCM5]SUZ46427.1 U2_small_nuclear_ribonucleoprotein_16.5K_-_putativeGeneDB:LmjF.36.0535 [Leishmania infantum]|eukprot:XP_001469552.1 putative small nuclear ribonucleaoprotein [Leishmania infantum JPCM5]